MKLFIMCAGTFAHTRNPRVSVETQPWVTITRSTTAVYLRENIAVLDIGRQCAVPVQLSTSQSPVMVHAQRIVNILRLMKMVTSSVDTQTSVTSEIVIIFCPGDRVTERRSFSPSWSTSRPRVGRPPPWLPWLGSTGVCVQVWVLLVKAGWVWMKDDWMIVSQHSVTQPEPLLPPGAALPCCCCCQLWLTDNKPCAHCHAALIFQLHYTQHYNRGTTTLKAERLVWNGRIESLKEHFFN